MNDFRISPDDPKLTAYALGELEGDELAAFEAALRRDPAAQAQVDAVRAFAAEMKGALAEEPFPSIEAAFRSELESNGAAPTAIVNGNRPDQVRPRELPPYEPGGATILRFPQFYFVVGGLAAACFAVVLALQPKPPKAQPPAVAPVATDTGSVATAQSDRPAPAPADVAATTPAAIQPTENMVTATVPAAESTVPSASAVAQVEPKTMPEVTAPTLTPELATPAIGELSATVAELTQAPTLMDQLKGAQVEIGRSTPAFNAASAKPAAESWDPLAMDGLKPGDLGITGSPPSFTVKSGALPEPAPITPHVAAKAARVESSSLASASVAPDASPVPTAGATPPAASTAESETEVVKLSAFLVAPSKQPLPPSRVPRTGRVASSDQKTEVASKNRPATRVLGTVLMSDEPGERPGAAGEAHNTEAYAYHRDNAFVTPAQSPFSTLSIDVDTASYANVRRFLQGGQLPSPDAVRIEELLNYFPFRYDRADGENDADKRAPFVASLEVADAPWAPTHRLVRIGLQARDVARADRPAANLVFLIDVSGSMQATNKLPLVKESMRLLIGKLRPDDRVAIVTYAGHSGLALPSTPVSRASEIVAALDALNSGGATNGAMGIQLAYDIAKANLVAGGINRVILCTDGDFNVGVTSQGDLARLVESKAKTGVELTALGFGMGNLKDSTLELLASKGNGNYGYIDTRHEAEKLLVEQVNGTLLTVAKDVKIQVDFNPERVAGYRLIGYENRVLKSEDFNNDAVDAGEIGSGHRVTALYEIVPVGVTDTALSSSAVDASRYAGTSGAKPKAPAMASSELLTVKVRFKEPGALLSKKLEFPLIDRGEKFTDASNDFKFAAAVAGFGLILRDSPYRGSATLNDVLVWAAEAAAKAADDPGGYRSEFIDLVRRAQALKKP